MTRTQIVSAIKSRFKQTTTELDTLIGEWVDEAYRIITKRFGWKELIVRNTQQALTAGTTAYNLPAAFFRIVHNSVRFYYTTVTTHQADLILPFVPADQAGAYEAMAQMTWPRAFTISSSATPGLKSLVVLPSFTQTGAYIVYDYYSRPDDYDTADANSVQDVSDYLIYYGLARIAEYFKDPRLESYNALAKEHKLAIFNEISQG